MPPLKFSDLLEMECYRLRQLDREIITVSSVAGQLKDMQPKDAILALACLLNNREWKGEMIAGTKKPVAVILSLDLV